MKLREVIGLFIDVLLFVAPFATGGKLGESIRIVALVVAGVAVVVALAFCVLLAVLLLDQRKPPYIEGIR